MMLYFFAFLNGVLTKYVDLVEEHGLRAPKISGLLCGSAYGVLLSIIVRLFPEVSTLVLAVVLGTIISGKINTRGHIAGVALFFILIFLLGTPAINWLLFAIILAVSFADEAFNSLVLDKKKIKSKNLSLIFSVRPFLEVTVFAYSLFTGEWVIWLTLLSSDFGYNLIPKALKSRLTSSPKARKPS
jgi:hypothetical protein